MKSPTIVFSLAFFEEEPMINRYKDPSIEMYFADESRYKTWFNVEQAVNAAREQVGNIPPGTWKKILEQAGGALARIVSLAGEKEQVSGHDVQAFVDAAREFLDPDLKRYFHEITTSTDTTEPALSLTILHAMDEVFRRLNSLLGVVQEQAIAHKHTRMRARTHGQHATMTTLGLEFLSWYDALSRRLTRIHASAEEIKFSKIRGMAGAYGNGLTPEIERIALEKLGLQPVKVCGQTVLRDRLADLMNDLAALGAVLEHIAVNIRLAAQTEVDEYSEPFKAGRKGSSIDPSKRNTDRTENATGLMRVVRGNAGVELENVATWRQRDISHSGPERIIVEDNFHLICFTLKRLTGIIGDLRINYDSLNRNIAMTQGVKAAPMVKTLLMEWGMDPDEAYRLVQQCSQYAWDNRKPFYSVLLESGVFPNELKTSSELKQCFDEGPRVEDVDAIFASYDL